MYMHHAGLTPLCLLVLLVITRETLLTAFQVMVLLVVGCFILACSDITS